jgi:hypothetical protein
MIRHLLLGTSFILASSVTFAAVANAEEPTAMANGTVTALCDFGNPQPGELILNSGGTALSSKNGGTPAKVDIDCTDDASLTISQPEQTTGLSGNTVFSDSNLTATASNTELGLSLNSTSNSTGNIVANADTGIKTIEVNMVADKGNIKISSGKYEFKVTLTATP